MERNQLKTIIRDQQPVELPDNIVSRTLSKTIQSLQKMSQILVISGIRRCGKSTLMQELRHQTKENHYYINFDDDRLAEFQLKDFQTLLEILMEEYGLQKTFYFDEIQNIEGWERFVRRLHDKKNKIYITGSNAKMFSLELGTRLTGRYIQLELFPYSFKEVLSEQRPDLLKIKVHTTIQIGEIRNLFSKFKNSGGFPDNPVDHSNSLVYLQWLYESILYRDIIARYKLNANPIRKLGYYLASNVGKEISYNALRKQLNLSNASTVADYCHYFTDCFLAFFVNRYDYSLRKQTYYAKKIYFIDTAMAKAVGFRISEDDGRLLENIVFLELKRRAKEIYFHKQKKECDFLIKKATKIIKAIQVCTELSSEKIQKREMEGLLEAMEMYGLKDGYILTERETDEQKVKHNGKTYKIHIIPVWYWLLHGD